MIGRSAKRDREDMEAAENLSEMVEALGHPPTLQRFIIFCAIGNVLVWLITIVFAEWVYVVMEKVVLTYLGMLILGVPLALGLFLSYCLFRLKLPGIEDNNRLDSGMMASYAYQAEAAKRWLVWLVSAIAGVLNVALLILANLYFADQLSQTH